MVKKRDEYPYMKHAVETLDDLAKGRIPDLTDPQVRANFKKSSEYAIRKIKQMPLKELQKYRNAVLAVESPHPKWNKFLTELFARLEAEPHAKTKQLRDFLIMLTRVRAKIEGIELDEDDEMTKPNRPTLAQLVAAAKELQKVLGAKPPLRTTGGDEEKIIKDLKEAATLLEPTDDITDETRWVLKEIKNF